MSGMIIRTIDGEGSRAGSPFSLLSRSHRSACRTPVSHHFFVRFRDCSCRLIPARAISVPGSKTKRWRFCWGFNGAAGKD